MNQFTFNELEMISEALYAKWERLKETEHQVYSNAIRGLMNRITKKKDALWDAEPSKIEPSTPLNCDHWVTVKRSGQYGYASSVPPEYWTHTFCPKCGVEL